MSDLRRELDELMAATGQRPVPQVSATGQRPAPPAPASLAEILGGHEVEMAGRRHWLVEVPFTTTLPAATVAAARFRSPLSAEADRGRVAEIEPARAMVLDIETGGLAAAPVFLVGVVLLDEDPLTVHQFLARDYPEEESVLQAIAALATVRDTWITYNGRSFDEPFLRDRATLHRVPLPPSRTHIDLLHAARRRWRRELPDCKLGTVEEHILNRPRVGDIPGRDVPELFHHFIRTGNARPLRAVLEHNRLDLISCTELLAMLSAE